MNEVQRSKLILKILNRIYPKTKIPLKHKNKFTLLISVLLSAQTTDVNVNNVTKDIYPKYHKPKHFMKLRRKKIEKLMIHAETFCQASAYIETLRVLVDHSYKDPIRKDLYFRYAKLVKPRLELIYKDWEILS